MAVPPASNQDFDRPASVSEAAAYFQVDQVTVRRWIVSGGPVLRHGRRGPGNGGLVDLLHMASWLGRANAPEEQTREDTMLQIAEALWKTLNEDHADIRSGASRADAAAVLLVAWERLCKTMGKSYRFDQCPEPIRTLMSEL